MQKKPTLDRLKGCIKLDNEQRIKYKVDDGFLEDETKTWNSYKKVINSYLSKVEDECYESAEDFATELEDMFNRLADSRKKHVGVQLLFSTYCMRLKNYYGDEVVRRQVMKYYITQKIKYQLRSTEKTAIDQTRSTMLTLATEQDILIQDEAYRRMSGKRSCEAESSGRSGDKKMCLSKSNKRCMQAQVDDADSDISESQIETHDSFDSVERHPKCKSYYDYFKDDKKQNWPVRCTQWITSDGHNVTMMLKKFRDESYKAAKMMHSISAERILSLSFIFILNQDNISGFIGDNKDKAMSIRRNFVEPKWCPIPEEAMLIAHTIDNMRHTPSHINEYMATMHTKYWNPSLEMSSYFIVMNYFRQHSKKLSASHTEQDHDCYEFFTKEVFKDEKYLTHKMSKHLSASTEYIPDFKLAYEHRFHKIYDLFIVEVKKDLKSFTPDNDDSIKINLELQTMLNELVKLGIEYPTVFGLIIQDHDCLLYQMSLEHEAQYVSRVIEHFYLPRDLKDISIVPRIMSIFLSIKDWVDILIDKLNSNKKSTTENPHIIRQGMKMPCIIEDPLQYCLSIDPEDYTPP